MYSTNSLWGINSICSNPSHEEYIASNFFAKTVFALESFAKAATQWHSQSPASNTGLLTATLNVTVFYTFTSLCIHWITREAHSIYRKFVLFGNPTLLIAVIFILSWRSLQFFPLFSFACRNHSCRVSLGPHRWEGQKSHSSSVWHKSGLPGSHPKTAYVVKGNLLVWVSWCVL